MCNVLQDQNYVLKNDNELLKLYKAGDQAAITVLLARYASLINSSASYYYISGADSDDNKQEAYMGLFKAIRSYDENKNASFYTYASRCISNHLKNFLASSVTKKAKINNNYLSIDDASFQEIDEYKFHQKLSNPETIFIQNEGYNALLKLTNEVLSELEKNVLFLYLSGCDYKLIATKLNSSQKSVDNSLQRARRKLKAVLNII